MDQFDVYVRQWKEWNLLVSREAIVWANHGLSLILQANDLWFCREKQQHWRCLESLLQYMIHLEWNNCRWQKHISYTVVCASPGRKHISLIILKKPQRCGVGASLRMHIRKRGQRSKEFSWAGTWCRDLGPSLPHVEYIGRLIIG